MSKIEIANADCLQYLSTIKNQSVDLVLIDPPYLISRDTNFATGKPTGRDTDRFRLSMDFGEWDKDGSYQQAVMHKVADEVYRILKKGGTFICFYDIWKITNVKQYCESIGFKQARLISWVKTNPVPINSNVNYLTNAREYAFECVKSGKPTFHSKYDNGIYSFPICQNKGRFHPTQKPVALIQALVEKHSNPGDMVVDCFSGSGTTAVACVRTGRNFLGCELDKDYYDKSIARVSLEQAKVCFD